MVKFRRRITLIKPKLQLKIVGAFLAIAVCCMAAEMWLLTNAIASAKQAIFVQPQTFEHVIKKLVWENLFIAISLLVPFSVAIGIILTSRIAGPIACFEDYFADLSAGNATEPCRIRDNDEFQELCGLINEAVQERRMLSNSPALERAPPGKMCCT